MFLVVRFCRPGARCRRQSVLLDGAVGFDIRIHLDQEHLTSIRLGRIYDFIASGGGASHEQPTRQLRGIPCKRSRQRLRPEVILERRQAAPRGVA